jgi:hypothetical protein
MSYMGGRLQPLFDPTPIRRACIDMADKGGERMTAITRMNTPVGHRPHEQGYVPGTLRASIKQKVMVIYRRRGNWVYESGAETDVEYAPYVEHGTGLWGPRRAMYEIKPKHPDGWLSWIDQTTGERIFAKRVMHPGSPGQAMFAIGAHLTEWEFHNFGQRRVQQWAREQERQGMRQRPVFYGLRLVA